MLLALMLFAASQAPPLRVVEVERTGLPPFVADQRVYRLEGQGSDQVRIGDTLDLVRQGSRLRGGRLQVVGFRGVGVLARLILPGETFPLVGDQAQRLGKVLLHALPAFQRPQEGSWPKPEVLAVQTVNLPQSGMFGPHREKLYFFPKDPVLSPAGEQKLQDWVREWGKAGTWTLEYSLGPKDDAALLQARAQSVKGKLSALGVSRVVTRPIPPEVTERFDVLHVVVEPW